MSCSTHCPAPSMVKREPSLATPCKRASARLAAPYPPTTWVPVPARSASTASLTCQGMARDRQVAAARQRIPAAEGGGDGRAKPRKRRAGDTRSVYRRWTTSCSLPPDSVVGQFGSVSYFAGGALGRVKHD